MVEPNMYQKDLAITSVCVCVPSYRDNLDVGPYARQMRPLNWFAALLAFTHHTTTTTTSTARERWRAEGGV